MAMSSGRPPGTAASTLPPHSRNDSRTSGGRFQSTGSVSRYFQTGGFTPENLHLLLMVATVPVVADVVIGEKPLERRLSVCVEALGRRVEVEKNTSRQKDVPCSLTSTKLCARICFGADCVWA